MARGIKLTDTVYEVDNGTLQVPATAIISTMLLRMDAFNLGTKKTKFKKSTNAANIYSLTFSIARVNFFDTVKMQKKVFICSRLLTKIY